MRLGLIIAIGAACVSKCAVREQFTSSSRTSASRYEKEPPRRSFPSGSAPPTSFRYFLLRNLRKEPYELSQMPPGIVRKIATRKSPQGVRSQRSSFPRRYIPGLLPHQLPLNNSFARAIEAAHGVRSFPQEEKTRKLDDKREERPCE